MLESVVLTSTRGQRGRLKARGNLARSLQDPSYVRLGHDESAYTWDWLAKDIQAWQQQELRNPLSQRPSPNYPHHQTTPEQLLLVLQHQVPFDQGMIPPSHQALFPDIPGSGTAEATSQRNATATASAGSSGLQAQQPKKRTRASKPKVRTGCIT
ncbi:unnamed protein product, partial [Parascedosporium putredinis]